MVATPSGVARAAIDGTITGGVADGAPSASLLSLSVTSVDPGTYEFDISDGSLIHNFDVCPGSNRCTPGTSLDKTVVGAKGDFVWDITLTPGTYTYQCDQHATMTKHFTVTGTGTTTTTATQTTQTTQTTSAGLAVRITSTHVSRSLVKVSAKASELSRVTAVLLHKGKRLARAAKDGTSVSLRLMPAHALKPGRYVVKVTVRCCGSSATAKKTIRVR
jgi:hypothetical protein